ncbi:MAG: aspartate aminotransferase family protein [Planctomycetes bacterium]|nr:aspartate aminotransferase family protein [Planctomycetota bacterium]
MSLDIRRILDSARGRQFDDFAEHVHPQWTRVLRTIGFNKNYVAAEGAHLIDAEGKRYLDFMSGWGVFNFGRNHPTIKQALLDVLESDFPGWIAFDAPILAAELARELKARVPNRLERVYFCNSGTETVEAALKFARRATGKTGFVHLKKAFHGLTNGALAANGDDSFRAGFEPFYPGGVQIELNDLAALERALETGTIGAFIFEPIQGKGVFLPEPGFLREAERLCRQHGALLIADEVQSGMGRTGKFVGYEWEDVDPDIVLFSKALSGGYVPVGAVLMRKEIYDKVYSSMEKAMVHACTFGMGNLAMAAGLAALQVLDQEQLIERAARMGALFRRGLDDLKDRFELIADVRGRGLMIGIEFGKPKSLGLRTGWSLIHKMDQNLFPQAVVIPLMDDHRILSQVAGHAIDVVKILPPLVVDESDVAWFLRGFEEVMVNLHKFPGPVWEVLKKLSKHAVSSRSREKAQHDG